MSESARDGDKMGCAVKTKPRRKKNEIARMTVCVHALKKTTLTPSDPTENDSNMQINST